MQSLKVSQLFIYPIKSLGGIELQSTRVLQKGFEFDRRWMLIDHQNQFLTQRDHALLALFKLSLNTSHHKFEVEFEGNRIAIPFEPTGETFKAEVWDDEVEVVEVKEEISHWFSERLPIGCKLVFFPEQNARLIEEAFRISTSDHTSLSDGYPILMVGDASFNDLNSRLAEPIPINRFRPNLVISGVVPYQEDSIKHFMINDLEFAGVKPCARCNVPTINQENGIAGKEPLRTLSSYRKTGNKVLFGQNVIPHGLGTISVGDELVVL